MRRLFGTLLLGTIALGSIALALPTPTVTAGQCVICPQIGILCGECYNLIPQSCNKCAYCKRIPGCHP